MVFSKIPKKKLINKNFILIFKDILKKNEFYPYFQGQNLYPFSGRVYFSRRKVNVAVLGPVGETF